MSHLGEDRLLALSRAGLTPPTAEEARHLAQCADCAGRLAEERQLTAAIAALPRPAVPLGFAIAARQRYLEALGARGASRLPISIWAASAIFLFWWSGCLWLGWVAASRNFAGLALVFSKAFTLVRVGWVVLAQSRSLWLFPVVAMVLLLVICLILLREQQKMPRAEISPVRDS